MIWAVTTWTDREALVFGYVREMPGPVESLADLGVFLALTRLVQRFPWLGRRWIPISRATTGHTWPPAVERSHASAI
jgi:hypothetical protein